MVQKYGGKASEMPLQIEIHEGSRFSFIHNGVDINYNKPDSVYPFKPTPQSA